MTLAEMVAYAYDQIDQARAELNLSRNRADMRQVRIGLSAKRFPRSRCLKCPSHPERLKKLYQE